jgi:CRP-like cAMP-binding protein
LEHHERILQNIAKHIALTPGEQQRFLAYLSLKKLPKRQFLLRENEVCRHSAFVVSGCLRGFIVDVNGFEHVLQFAPPDWWIADMYSLLSGLPGHLNIDALEDTEVLLLAKTDQELLYREIPAFERFFRIITENSLVANRQRVIDNMSLSARERYLLFCRQYPTLIYSIPQKQIAAYIGVTPEFLSKMRSEMAKKR